MCIRDRHVDGSFPRKTRQRLQEEPGKPGQWSIATDRHASIAIQPRGTGRNRRERRRSLHLTVRPGIHFTMPEATLDDKCTALPARTGPALYTSSGVVLSIVSIRHLFCHYRSISHAPYFVSLPLSGGHGIMAQIVAKNTVRTLHQTTG